MYDDPSISPEAFEELKRRLSSKNKPFKQLLLTETSPVSFNYWPVAKSRFDAFFDRWQRILYERGTEHEGIGDS